MVMQNNPAPWVILALVVLGGAIALGVLLSDTELLNPTREMQKAYAAGTMSAIEAIATRANWAATETPRVAGVLVAQTQAALPAQATQTSQAFIAQATEIAGQQTATAIAAHNTFAMQSLNATQTVFAAEVQNEIIASWATQTAIAQAAILARERARTEEIGMTLDLIGQLLFLIIPFILIVTIIALVLVNARTKENAATAKMYTEMRRTLELQAAIRAKTPIPAQTQIIPAQSVAVAAKLPKNGDKELPKILTIDYLGNRISSPPNIRER